MRTRLLLSAGAVASGAALAWRIITRRRRLALRRQLPRPEPAAEAARSSAAHASIEASAQDILERLKRSSPVQIVDPELHYLAPHVPKAEWTALGDLVAAREAVSTGRVDGSQWISLRLDGCGFSKAVRLMRGKRILEPEGFSDVFADCMVGALRMLLEHFHGALGYTQSDEMVAFIPPTSVVRGERQPHSRTAAG